MKNRKQMHLLEDHVKKMGHLFTEMYLQKDRTERELLLLKRPWYKKITFWFKKIFRKVSR